MSAAAAILAKPLCALAFCWRLERRDGIAIGLTSHDRPLMIDRFRYHPSPGMTPSAIQKDGSGRAQALEIGGGLSSGAISVSDLETGRWDGASLALHLTEWTDPGSLWLLLARGLLGSVQQRGGEYRVGVTNGFDLLDAQVVPETSPTCRAALGDNQCTVDIRPLVRVRRVDHVDGDRVKISGLAIGAYAFGQLRWMEGPLAGLTQTITAQDGDTLILADPPDQPIAAGTRVRVIQGCDRRLATCSSRFTNTANFRGEPFLPGMDLLTRYPGG